MKNNSIEDSLIKTIENESIKEITIDVSEVVLDSFLQEGLLKEIPFFGTLYKGYKGVLTIRDALFAKKVLFFLTKLEQTSEENRLKFIKECEDLEYRRKVGQELVLILERLDSIEKANIIGNLFKSYLDNHINYDQFLRLSSVVQNAYVPDIYKLNKSSYYSEVTTDHFVSIGLLKTKLGNELRRGSSKLKIDYELTRLAFDLIKHGLRTN